MTLVEKGLLCLCVFAAGLGFYAQTTAAKSEHGETTPTAAPQSQQMVKTLAPAHQTAGCAEMLLINPFSVADLGPDGTGKCAHEPPAPTVIAAEPVSTSRAQLDQIWPCEANTESNTFTPQCAASNAKAAALVGQLELSAAQGNRQASADLANLVQSRKKSASGAYLDALEHAQASVMQIAANGRSALP